MAAPFRDRSEAGRRLADAIVRARPAGVGIPLVLGLPRGGVPVAAEVARRLGAPLDVLVVRKLRVPGQPELAMGAVGPGGVVVVEEDVARRAGIGREALDAAVAAEEPARAALELELRGVRPPPDLRERDVVLVDDGLATGASARAAVQAARAAGAQTVLLGVPVGSRPAAAVLRGLVDVLVCLREPARFEAVSRHYDVFDQVPSVQVRALLGAFRSE